MTEISHNHPADPPRELIARWDTCEIAHARAVILKEDNPSLSDKEAFEQACLDDDIFQMEWDWLLEDVETILREISPHGSFRAEGLNMGWRRRSGWKEFRARDAQEFLRELLPDTDCTFTIERAGQTLHIANYHHDAPTGEFYTVMAHDPDAEDSP